MNLVSLDMVEDACAKYKDYFPKQNPVSTKKAVKAYERSVMGRDNGKVIRV